MFKKFIEAGCRSDIDVPELKKRKIGTCGYPLLNTVVKCFKFGKAVVVIANQRVRDSRFNGVRSVEVINREIDSCFCGQLTNSIDNIHTDRLVSEEDPRKAVDWSMFLEEVLSKLLCFIIFLCDIMTRRNCRVACHISAIIQQNTGSESSKIVKIGPLSVVN